MATIAPLPSRPSRPVRWDELTTEDLRACRARGISLAVLPVGATEQHGPHLPLGVDTLSAEAVALAASARSGVPVLPALPYGCSLGHSSRWPGTISLRPATLAAVLLEIAEWIGHAGFDRLLVLNGHVTNWAPLRCGLEEIRHQRPGLRIGLRNLWDLSAEAHACYHADAANFHANCAETGLIMHLRPDLVHRERIVDEPDRSVGHLFSYRVDQETRSGVVGTPSTATADAGRALFDLLVGQLTAQLQAAQQERTPLEDDPGP